MVAPTEHKSVDYAVSIRGCLSEHHHNTIRWPPFWTRPLAIAPAPEPNLAAGGCGLDGLVSLEPGDRWQHK